MQVTRLSEEEAFDELERLASQDAAAHHKKEESRKRHLHSDDGGGAEEFEQPRRAQAMNAFSENGPSSRSNSTGKRRPRGPALKFGNDEITEVVALNAMPGSLERKDLIEYAEDEMEVQSPLASQVGTTSLGRQDGTKRPRMIAVSNHASHDEDDASLPKEDHVQRGNAGVSKIQKFEAVEKEEPQKKVFGLSHWPEREKKKAEKRADGTSMVLDFKGNQANAKRLATLAHEDEFENGFHHSPLADGNNIVLGPKGQNLRIFRPSDSPGALQAGAMQTGTDSMDADELEEFALYK
eukprot:CAMPEP_0113880224 /NCGR_PEP_ID=MMETSP0780_2-20120614/7666_1 /TAXON_ID=652834 /ORGANISM="Palpitomonas bilix" /LENGTH=294 /DNA_ID=CAMNT_0000866875 /DNA_START=235 /DNA_END=1120 /DNA_ORIENTATION=- /assembly_acc=CAM_ASM_000599